MIKVVVLVIGLWSCQLCYGEPSGHVNAKTTAPEPPLPSPSPTTTVQDATAASLDSLPTSEAVAAPEESHPEDGKDNDSNKYSYSIGNLDRAYGQISMFSELTAFEDTTQGQRIYVTLPESQPLHVPYTTQHRFGPVLRDPQRPTQEAKKFDENIVLLEDNKGPSDSPYDTILKPLFISPDLIQLPLEEAKNEEVISPTNSPDNPSGSLADLQKLFQYTKTLVNDNDVLVINDAAAATTIKDSAEANVRNFTNFEGENEIDQMAVESAADRNMTMMMNETVEAAQSPTRIGRSGMVDDSTAITGEAIDGEDDDDEREGAESKIRYSRFRKITPIVVKAAEDEDCDDDSHGLPEAQALIKVTPTRDYLPSKETPTRDYLPSKVNVEILEDHNNGQFLKETVFLAAPPKTESEAPSRQFLNTFTGHTLSPTTSTVTHSYKTVVNTTPLPPPIPLGLRLTPPKTDIEDCDDPPAPAYRGKTIVEVQKSVSFTERRVTNNNPQTFRSGSRFASPPTSKCLNDCSTPHPPAPTYIPARPQQIIVEKPVIVDRVVEKPIQVTVEKIVNRPYPVDRIVEKQVPYPVEKVVERLVPQPYAVEKQVPVTVEKFVDRPYPVERIVEKPVPYPVEKVVERLVPQPYEVEKPVQVTVEKIVDRPYPVERIVEKPVPYPVEKVVERLVPQPYAVEKQVPVTVEKIIDRPYPVDRIVEKEVPVPYPVEKIVHVDRPYPVETVVEKIVDRPVEVETIVETPVPVPVPHHIHHYHNTHSHEHILHPHSHSHPSHVIKHVHLDQVPYSISGQALPHYDYSKSTETHASTLLKPVHKLLGSLWNKLHSPFFGNHHQTHKKHVTLPLYKTKYHSSDNHLYAGSYGYVPDSLPGGSLYNGVAIQDNHYYGPAPVAKYDPYWSYGRTNYLAPAAPVSNTIHLTPNRYNYRRHMNFLKNIRWEYGGFKPPLIPSVEIDEFGNPIHRDLDSRRR